MKETISWWRVRVNHHDVTTRAVFRAVMRDATKRSAMVLKGLTNAPTGRHRRCGHYFVT